MTMRFLPWVILLVLPGSLRAQVQDVEELDPPRDFIRNAGQWASVFEYGLLDNGNAAMLSREGITFYTQSTSLLEDRAVPVENGHSRRGPFLDVARVRFIEPSRRMRLRARDTSDAVAHFYRGTDPSRWHENVSNHRRIAYENLWEGIDAIMENGPSGCRLRFDLAPAADPGRIRLHIADPVADRMPSVWIERGSDGSAGGVRASLARMGDDTYRIALADTGAAVFRITLDFGTYLGGTGDETAFSVVVDAKGEICFTGQTNAVDFPVVDAWQDQCAGGYDRFLTKLSCDGRRILFSTYYGGSNDEDNWVIGHSHDTHMEGRRAWHGDYLESTPNGYYTVGTTGSPDFPITPDAPVHPVVPDTNGVLLRFNLDGTLRTSMRLGAPGAFPPFAVIADHAGNVIVTGAVLHDRMWFITPESVQPAIRNTAYRHTLCGAAVKFVPDLSNVIFGTYFYAPDGDNIATFAPGWSNVRNNITPVCPRITPFVDLQDNILLLGTTLVDSIARMFPLVNALPNMPTDRTSIYATKITSDGSRYIFSTTLGGDRNDYFGTAVVDHHGNVHIQGQTGSLDYPMENAFQRHAAMGGHECYTVLAPDGTLLRSSYLYGQDPGELFMQPNGDIQFYCSRSDSLPWYLPDPANGWQLCSKPFMFTLDRTSGTPKQATWLTEPNYIPFCGSISDPRGYICTLNIGQIPLGDYDDTCMSYVMKNAIQPRIAGGMRDTHISRFRIDGVSDAFSCDLLLPDSVRVGRHRGLAEPDSFDVTVEFTNMAVRDPLRIWYVELELPPGIALHPSTQDPRIRPVPDLIGPGMRGAVTWHVRVGRFGFSLGRRIRARVYYAEPGAAGECPPGWGSCEKDLNVRYYEEDEPRLACMLDVPDTLGMLPDEATPLRLTVPYRLYTLGGDTARISSVTFGVGRGMGVRMISSGRKVGRTLPPGDTLLLYWELEAERRADFRTVTVRAVAEDTWGYPLSVCEDSLTITPVALQCRLEGDDAVTYSAGSGTLDHDSLRVELELRNPADTSQDEITVLLDLSAAVHLRLRPGQSALRGPFGMDADTLRTETWWLEPEQPIADAVTDTVAVRFRRAGDSSWQECLWLIALRVFDENVLCSIAAPPAVSEPEVLARDPLALTCTVRNAGTVAVAAARYVLEIAPGSGVTTADPLQRPGGTIDPGNDVSLAWTLRALALRDARTARFTVTGYDAQDEIFVVCTHEMEISGVDGLRCAITAPDTVRFERDSLRYEPDPVPVSMDLSNVLDTEETAIEAEIDLAGAPRLELSEGETAVKTLALIDSHSVARFTWLLSPRAEATDDNQDIVIRYRSTEQGNWKECRTTVHIEAWPEIAELRCATGGHDSLFADGAYEIIVPEPFQLSYTATNSGTVTLTGCAAAIVLPEGFALAGSDSVQQFGTLVPGTLAPNESATRWWTVTVTDQLQDFGAKDITWVWTSDQQGSGTGCTHVVQVVPDPSSGITLTPLRLDFEAELDGPLPAAQAVKLWTGGGLAMPWTAQSDTWYIDLAPVAGDHAASIYVQPNTTMLNKGLHKSTITLAGAAPNLPRRIAVDYMITSLTGISEQAAARTLTLGAVYPHPIPLDGEARLLLRSITETPVRITLHDLLGRERALLRDDIISETDILILRPAALGLTPGSYLLRALTPAGMSSRMLTVVR